MFKILVRHVLHRHIHQSLSGILLFRVILQINVTKTVKSKGSVYDLVYNQQGTPCTVSTSHKNLIKTLFALINKKWHFSLRCTMYFCEVIRSLDFGSSCSMSGSWLPNQPLSWVVECEVRHRILPQTGFEPSTLRFGYY